MDRRANETDALKQMRTVGEKDSRAAAGAVLLTL